MLTKENYLSYLSFHDRKLDEVAAEVSQAAIAAGRKGCKLDSFRQKLLADCGSAVSIDDGIIIIDQEILRQELDCLFPGQPTEIPPVPEDYLPFFAQLPHDRINFGSPEGAKTVLAITEIIRGRNSDADYLFRQKLQKGHLHGSRI